MTALLFILLFMHSATDTSSLKVEVNGLRSDKGTVIVRLWQDKDTWLKKEGVLIKAKTSIVNGKAVCEINNLKPGKYALALVHDENNNGHLDFNFAKIPREGTGASNNASATFGPPPFEAALFIVAPGSNNKIAVKVKYYL